MTVSMVEPQRAFTAAALRLWLLTLCLAPLTRVAARATWRAIVPPERAVLVGSGPLELATRRKLELFRDIHVDCAGRVPDDAGLDRSLEVSKALEHLWRSGDPADRVILASNQVDERLIASLVDLRRAGRLKLSVVPPARGMFGTAAELRHIADLPLIEYSTWDVGRSTVVIKRAIDVIGSSIALAVTAPLLALIAIAVKSTVVDRRCSSRSGQAGPGEPFRMYKFRTMTANAEQRLCEVVNVDELPSPMFKLRDDPRVTRIGRVLRRTSLHELPQLVNVWRGDMSLVGPRPEELALVERYQPEHKFRLAVKPGLTGPMQVYGRGELEFEERLAVEREYVENVSVRRDLRIIVLTAAAVFRGSGAY